MAQKKRKRAEFRPDKSGTGILSKLYLTARQRTGILRWALIAAVLILLSLVQDTVLCRLRVLGAAAALVPCGILLVCVIAGVERGAVFAVIAALCYVFSGTAPGAYVVALLPALGIFAAMFRQSYLRKGFSAALLCTAAALLLYSVAVYGVTLLSGLTTLRRAFVPLIGWALTLPAIPALYPAVNAIEKMGGNTWKE